MVFAQKTFVQKGIDVEISTISLTLQKGFGVRSSGIPLALIKDQFDRAKNLVGSNRPSSQESKVFFFKPRFLQIVLLMSPLKWLLLLFWLMV
jgi:hypothetical protein